MRRYCMSDRRDFLKTAAAGVAGLTIANVDKSFAASAGWTDKMPINPDIDNMRVVCCNDAKMLKKTMSITSFAAENDCVDSARVAANMDDMARMLAAKPNQPLPAADAAWRTIFRSGKAWQDTKVAIKVNCVKETNMVRAAILQKLCAVLTGFGAQPGNIIIYDGCHSAAGTTKYSPYFSTTDSTKIPGVVSSFNDALKVGADALLPVTLPGLPSGLSVKATAQLASGAIDILINCAPNKGHDRPANGNFTLCMKNHFGTIFSSNSSYTNPSGLHDNTQILLNSVKLDAIIGGNPVRQQLCIIDSLVGSTAHDPAALPDVVVNRLIMGTFAPAVDYLCVKNVREPVMKATHAAAFVDSFLGAFGYANADPQWVEFTGGTVGVQGEPHQTDDALQPVEIVLASSSFKQTSVHFSVPKEERLLHVGIFDMQGRSVREFDIGASTRIFFWDGRSMNGQTVSSGSYIIRIRSKVFEKTERILAYK